MKSFSDDTSCIDSVYICSAPEPGAKDAAIPLSELPRLVANYAYAHLDIKNHPKI